MNILEQFEQEAFHRLLEHANKVDITQARVTKNANAYIYECIAYLDNRLCIGAGESQGVAIDRCIAARSAYSGAERVELKSEE